MLIAVVLGLLFVRPYIGTIIFSGLIAFVFNPVYKAVLRKTHRQGLALTTTILAAILSFVLPIALIVGVTITQANSLVSNFQSGSVKLGPAQVQSTVERGTARVNNVLKGLPGHPHIDTDKKKIGDELKKLATQAVQALINVVKSAGGAFFGFITTVILAFFLIVAMLRYQAELIRFIKQISPFHENVTELYLSRAGAMTKAMVKGQFIIAVAQGFASAFSLWIVGVDYFWFFFMLLSFLSFIPLGAGILTIPIGIVIAATGNVAQGVFVILFHILVVSNIDNFLRPQLVPRHVRLNPALVLLSVFSGLAVFGAPGVIYGPVIMILLITTFTMYADYAKTVAKPAPPSH